MSAPFDGPTEALDLGLATLDSFLAGAHMVVIRQTDTGWAVEARTPDMRQGEHEYRAASRKLASVAAQAVNRKLRGFDDDD